MRQQERYRFIPRLQSPSDYLRTLRNKNPLLRLRIPQQLYLRQACIQIQVGIIEICDFYMILHDFLLTSKKGGESFQIFLPLLSFIFLFSPSTRYIPHGTIPSDSVPVRGNISCQNGNISTPLISRIHSFKQMQSVAKMTSISRS